MLRPQPLPSRWQGSWPFASSPGRESTISTLKSLCPLPLLPPSTGRGGASFGRGFNVEIPDCPRSPPRPSWQFTGVILTTTSEALLVRKVEPESVQQKAPGENRGRLNKRRQQDLRPHALLPCNPAARRADNECHLIAGNHHDITCHGEKLPPSTAPTFRPDSLISQSASRARLTPSGAIATQSVSHTFR